MILADFLCPEHGRFELLSDVADEVPCPTCGVSSPWAPSPVFGRVQLVTATRGKYEKPPTPQHLDTFALGEGQRYSEWRAERKKMWRDHDYRIRKERAKS